MHDTRQRTDESINSTYKKYLNDYMKIEKYIKSKLSYFNENAQNILIDYLNYYKNNRLPRFEKIIKNDLTQTGYLSVISEMNHEIDVLNNDYNKLKNEIDILEIKIKEEESTRKQIHSLSFWGGLLGSNKTKNKDMEYVLKELEFGNPDHYINQVGYIDDFVIDNLYPIEKEDMDEFDDE